MTLDSGRGGVIQKNYVLLNDSLVPGRLTACKHANGRDWWLIAHKFNTNRYYKFLITPTSIAGPYFQDIGSIRDAYRGQYTFSPDGKWFASYEPYLNDLDIFEFDRCTGNLSNTIHVNINDSANCGGVAFSPNSKVLYVSSTIYVYQFNLDAVNIASSQLTVATWDGYYSPYWPQASLFYHAQIAPDGKIYIDCANSTVDIHVINNPDSLGFNCDVCQHCIPLPSFNAYTIPNHPNFFLGADHGSACDSLTTSISSVNNLNKISVYPNPAIDGYVTVSYPQVLSSAAIIISNILGEEIQKIELPRWSSVHRINLRENIKGIYLLNFTDNLIDQDVKFIVD
jgi:hypothetical protein